jgi:hypothetical protein
MYLGKERGIVLFVVIGLVFLIGGFLFLDSNNLTGAVIGVLPLDNDAELNINLTNESQHLVEEKIQLNNTNQNESLELIESNEFIVNNTSNDTFNDENNQLGILDLRIQANCGGVTSCNCGDVITSNYNFASNLSCSSGNGLTIGSDNLVIDCLGYNLTGGNDFTVNKYGIYNVGYDNITINNCTILNFNNSIYFENSTNNEIVNNTLDNNNVSIYILNTNSSIFRNNNFLATFGMYSSNYNIIDNNTITNDNSSLVNPEYNLNCWYDCNNNNITNNIIYSSTQNGGGWIYSLFINYGENNKILKNNITAIVNSGVGADYATGIKLLSTNNNLVDSNIINSLGYSWFGSIWLVSNYNDTFSNNIINAEVPSAVGNGAINIESLGGNVFINNNITCTSCDPIVDSSGNSHINYLVYNNSYGEIKWTNSSDDSFLKNMDINISIGLGINIFIDENVVAFNTSSFDSNLPINSSVDISFFNQNYTSVTNIFKLDNYSVNNSFILNHGEDCFGVDCNFISFILNDFTFNTSSLGSFTINGTNATENTAPNTSQIIVNFSKSSNSTFDNVLCRVKGLDIEHTYLLAQYKWYKDNVENVSGNIVIQNDTLTTISTLLAVNTNSNENWTCSVKMYDGITNETDWNNNSVIPVTNCNDMVTYSYTMSENLTGCTDNGLRIEKDNTILDCNGYSIEGIGSENGILVNNFSNVKIHDCYINNFNKGIFINGSNMYIRESSNITIINISVSNSTYGVYLDDLVYNVTINDSLFSNVTNGIYDNTVDSDNTFHGGNISFYNNVLIGNNGGNGIYILNNNTHSIYGNNISSFVNGTSSQASNSIFENNIFENNINGYALIRGLNNNFINEEVYNNSIGIKIENRVGTRESYLFSDSYFRDCLLENNTIDLSYVHGNNVTFINSSINKTKLEISLTSDAFVKWYVQVNVTDSKNNSLEDSIVKGYNSVSELENTTDTNSNGIGKLELTEFYRNYETNYYLTPSTIIASKDNYTTNSTTVNLYNLTYAQVNLTLTEVNCGANLSADFGMGNNYTCSGNGLNITSDNIIINGKGNALIGDGDGIGIDVNGKNNIQIYNLTITNFSRAINFVNSNHSNFTLITVYNNTYGIVYNISNNNSVYDSNLYNNSHSSVYTINNGGTNNSLVNTTININEVNVSGTANIFLKWYVNVNATYNNESALPNADLYGYYNNTGLLDGSATTDSNGIGRLVLSELKKNVSEITYLTPHNITLSYSYLTTNITNSTSINLSVTNNTNVNLSIALNCTSPSVSKLYYNDVTFCPGIYSIYNHRITIANDSITITCLDTELPQSAIQSTNYNHTIIQNCKGIRFSVYNPYNITIKNNYDIKSSYFSNGDQIIINNNTFETWLGLFVINSSRIINNSFSPTLTSISFKGDNTQFIDNNFLNPNTGIFTFGNSSNNSFYYNNFSTSEYNIYFNSTISENTFNTSFNNSAQGNIYSDYCDKGVDNNGDGYADASSSGTTDWPYSANITSKVYDASPGNTGVIDYGPFIQSCPADDVFLGSSSGGGSSSSSSGGGNAPAAPSSSQTVTQPDDVYSASEASEFLKIDTETRGNNNNLEVKFTLENTGTKTMRLFPEIFQDVEDPFFIVTKKTLGYENSFFSRLAKLSYSEDAVSGRLLKAEIEEPEQIILEPGQTLEKTLTIKEGLVPSKLKVQFTTLGESVTEQEITSTKKVLSGTAVDITSDKNSFDIYAVIVPEELTESYQEYYQEQSQDLLTASAVADITSTDNEYMLEVNLIRKNPNALMSQSSFSDLYGPYKLKKAQNFIFAQQFKYNPEYYYGDYVLKTRIYKSDKTLVENEFDIDLGLKTIKGKTSLTGKATEPVNLDFIPQQDNSQESFKIGMWIVPIIAGLFLLLLIIRLVKLKIRKTL